jgi:hypothetical protein
MNLQTIRISAPISDDNPHGFVLINHTDFNHDQHEPFDDEARAVLAGAISDREPTKAELLAARDEIISHRAALDAEQDRLRAWSDELAAEAERLHQQAALQAAEAQRLAEAGKTDSALTVAQLRDALTAKGIAFDATAKKADLQALLDAAV